MGRIRKLRVFETADGHVYVGYTQKEVARAIGWSQHRARYFMSEVLDPELRDLLLLERTPH